METKRLEAFVRGVCAAVAIVLCGACSHGGLRTPGLDTIAPLEHEGHLVTPGHALNKSAGADLLALSPEMIEFADRYVRTTGSRRQRLHMLHHSLRSPALVDIDYDPGADGTAAEVFASGRANCLSYAHLFIALARYSGLNANYQTLVLRPEWIRHGERVALQRHVNSVVTLRNGDAFMVDIDPVERRRVVRTDTISDREALALHENNIAMNRLLEKDIAGAYRSLLRALDANPGLDYLWVNLGAIYRQSGQDAEAEASYRVALGLNPGSASAMNNLSILYEEQGQLEEAAALEEKLLEHRRRNPYYHSLLAERAEAEHDLDTALLHYRRALSLKREDPDINFRLGQVYMRLGRREEAIEHVRLAIEHAELISERSRYQAWLDSQVEELASLPQGAG